MRQTDILQILLYLVILIALAIPLGRYMFKVYTGERTPLDRVLRPLERLIYRFVGVEVEKEMGWREYAVALLVFNFLGIVLLFLLQLAQGYLPFNPQQFGAVKPDLAFNTATSFTTNTNWQSYSGESTMSYLTQMAGLAVQNFLSAATGMVVVIALTRGLARRRAATIGNFWID
ncbi:MAG: potassium-transporting ATPase subunit KdpA, partial [Desulfotomaculaceae bacterium]